MTSAIQHESAFSPTLSSRAQLGGLLGGTGIWVIKDAGWIRVTGTDRVRWLNGMVTNAVQTLQPGQGCYNFVLSAQGRIQGDAYAFAQEDALLLETGRARIPSLIALLDRFIIMDDVDLADISGGRCGLAVAGPEAAKALEAAGIPVDRIQPISGEPGLRTMNWLGGPLDLVHTYSPLIPRFEIWGDEATIDALARQLTGVASAGLPESGAATVCEAEAVEWLSLLEGIPRYGADIRDRELPQETGQTRALHFTKGCYLGQEIVERIRSRGAVHRVFSGFLLCGDLPGQGVALHSGGKPVGELTRAGAVPLSGGTVQIGLGYVRREALEQQAELEFSGGIAVPVALPFREP